MNIFCLCKGLRKLIFVNISRYVDRSADEEEIDLLEVNKQLKDIEKRIQEATEKHNKFLDELGLPRI